jgi:hypothetical protein
LLYRIDRTVTWPLAGVAEDDVDAPEVAGPQHDPNAGDV